MLKNRTDRELATELRALRMQMRPVFNELTRRGFRITEAHGHSRVPVTTFENIIISKPSVIKL